MVWLCRGFIIGGQLAQVAEVMAGLWQGWQSQAAGMGADLGADAGVVGVMLRPGWWVRRDLQGRAVAGSRPGLAGGVAGESWSSTVIFR